MAASARGRLLVGLGAHGKWLHAGHGICGLAFLQVPSSLAVVTFLAAAIATAALVARLGASVKLISLVAVLAGGVLFNFGLALSAMISPEVVLSFLRLQDLGACSCWAARGRDHDLLHPGASADGTARLRVRVRHTRRGWTGDTIVGSAIFGAGWGLCGVCPGPASRAWGRQLAAPVRARRYLRRRVGARPVHHLFC